VTSRNQPDRRAQLTRAAFDVFTDRGYRNSSVADIVAVAGLGHGSFYNYFPNKRAILDATIDLGLEERAPELSPPERLADTLDDFLDALTTPLVALHSLSVTDTKLVSLIMFDAGAIDDALTQRVFDIYQSFAEAIQRQIDHGVAVGYLRNGLDSHVLAEMVICVNLTVLLPTLGGPPLPGGPDHVIAQIRARLRAGLPRDPGD